MTVMTWPQLCWTGPKVVPGIYRHYKGDLYEVLSVATHSESEEPLVIYRSLKAGRIWARPCDMFVETVELSGGRVPRFELVEQQADRMVAQAR